jgi:hypothetical protein
MISPKANNREKTGRRLFGTGGVRCSVLARLRIIFGSGGAERAGLLSGDMKN